MTGSLSYGKAENAEGEHTRLLLSFANDYELAYDCTRRLGTVDLADAPGAFIEEHDLGPDALEVNADAFAELLGSRGGIKSALMRQKRLAGIGNVYADEILFQTYLHPEAAVADLDDDLRRHLHRIMPRVLRTAADRRADPRRLPRSWLLPRRHEGAACPRCAGEIERATVAGRATYLCPTCQPAPMMARGFGQSLVWV